MSGLRFTSGHFRHPPPQPDVVPGTCKSKRWCLCRGFYTVPFTQICIHFVGRNLLRMLLQLFFYSPESVVVRPVRKDRPSEQKRSHIFPCDGLPSLLFATAVCADGDKVEWWTDRDRPRRRPHEKARQKCGGHSQGEIFLYPFQS